MRSPNSGFARPEKTISVRSGYRRRDAWTSQSNMTSCLGSILAILPVSFGHSCRVSRDALLSGAEHPRLPLGHLFRDDRTSPNRNPFPYFRLGGQVAEGPHERPIANPRPVGVGMDHPRTLSHQCVGQAAARPDFTATPDRRFSSQGGERKDAHVGAQANPDVDEGRGGIFNGDPLAHPVLEL